MKNLTKLLPAIAFLLISATTYSQTDYYWVGGTGNWDDAGNHWAATSGGTDFYGTPPGESSNVYFDANSFTSANDTFYFASGMNQCNSFIMLGVQNHPTFSDAIVTNAWLDLGSDFKVDSNISWSNSMQISMEGYMNGVIQTHGLPMNNDVQISLSLGRVYTLQSDIHFRNILIGAADFNSAGFAITCDNVFNIASAGYVYLGTSVIQAGGRVKLYTDINPQHTLGSDSATFITPRFDVQGGLFNFSFRKVVAGYITGDNCIYDSVQCEYFDGNNCSIQYFSGNGGLGNYYFAGPPNYITTMDISDTVSFAGRWIVDTIRMTHRNAVLYISENDTLFLTGELSFNGPATVAGALGQSYIYKSSGIYCYDSLFVANCALTGGAVFYGGAGSFDNGGNYGWKFLSCDGTGGVWPGDVNNDLAVDNYDVLEIGVNYGQTGYGRSDAGIEWEAKGCNDWNMLQSNGKDMKFADCNGDGIVDSLDLNAVSQNYGMTHALRRMYIPQQLSSSPPVIVKVLSDSVNAGSHLSIDISMGTAQSPADSTYGIAFSINFNPALINPDSLNFDFSGSWLGTPGTNMIGFIKPIISAGRIDFALTRIDHVNIGQGSGHLMSVGLVTSDAVTSYSNLQFEATEAIAVTSNDTARVLTGTSDSAIVNPVVTHVMEAASKNHFAIYPNPSDKTINLKTDLVPVKQVDIYSILGEKVFSANYLPPTIETAGLKNGTYYIRCQTEDGIYSYLIEILHN